MDDTVRYFRDIIFVRYLMELDLSIELDIFVDDTIHASYGCGHISVPTLTLTAFSNRVAFTCLGLLLRQVGIVIYC